MVADIEKLMARDDFESLFAIGPYNHNSNSRRIYLDEITGNGIELYDKVRQKAEQILRSEIVNGYFVCLCSPTSEELTEFPSEKLIEIENCGIKIPADSYYTNRYIDEDEWWMNYIFFKGNPEDLTKLVKYSISNNFNETDVPNFPCSIFFVDENLSSLVNIYDDRGMDIVSLKTTHNTSHDK